jgi:hypothetical protein
MRDKLSKTSDISSETRGGQPVSGPGKDGETTGENQFAFGAKFAIIVGLVLLAFWLLDRVV